MISESAVVPTQDTSQLIAERERQYLLQNYARYPLALARGKGSYVYDFSGKRYLDLITGIGVNALGHAHPRLVRAIRDQAGKLIHCSNLYYHEYQGRLAEVIAKRSGLDRCFFANSGTEAVEGALKMVRSYGHRIGPEKYEIVALENSFHGRTMGALSVTGQPKYRKDFEPLLPGVRFVPVRDDSALEAAVTSRTAGIVLEVIQGEGGVYPICERMLRKAKQLCEQFDALLVFDEIQCGVGRSGTYFAYQMFDPVILPDVMVTAKPIANGLPLGVIACNERAAASIAAGMHGSTFGGGVLACRVACEFFEVLDEILPQVREQGAYFKSRLEALMSKYEFIKEVRGFGLMLGVELRMPGKQIVSDAIEQGLLINCTHETVLRFLPPFTLSRREVDLAIRILEKLFTRARGPWAEYQSRAGN
ncbi:MAG: aspartate aminotransferase family protein [Bryobacterales bacterium]|nr:aspartate aminotransferase family protein [Bryobacterales bacterium]